MKIITSFFLDVIPVNPVQFQVVLIKNQLIEGIKYNTICEGHIQHMLIHYGQKVPNFILQLVQNNVKLSKCETLKI